MNINCSICQDLFVPSSDVVTVTCGHIFHSNCLYQWLERSKTCPQCRHKVNTKHIYKIYFNIGRIDNEITDVATLSNKLDSLSSDFKEKEKALKIAHNKVDELKSVNLGLRQEIRNIESEKAGLKSQVLILKDQLKDVKEWRVKYKSLQHENEKMVNHIAALKSISDIIRCAEDEVKDMLQGTNDTRSLATIVVTLKKELAQQSRKKNALRSKLAQRDQDLRETINKVINLEQQVTTINQLKDDLNYAEEERISLIKKISELEKFLGECSFANKSQLQRQLIESPAPETSKRKEDKPSEVSTKVDETNNMDKISKSPYLKVKSNSYSQISPPNKHSKSKLNCDDMMIFKKTKHTITDQYKTTSKSINLGGHSPVIVFPTPKINSLKRSSSTLYTKPHKLKKLAPLSKQTRKITDFIEID